jgi:hypothetical protein
MTSALLPAAAVLLTAGCMRPARILWQQNWHRVVTGFGAVVATDGQDVIVGTTAQGLSGPGGTGLVLLRYDARGRLAWSHDYARPAGDSLAALAVAPDHSIIATGRTGSEPDTVRLLLARFAVDGEVKWTRNYALGRYTRGAAVSVDDSSRITVCGSVSANGENSDVLVAQFTADGELSDKQVFDFGGDEYGQDMVQEPDAANTFVAAARVPRRDPGVPVGHDTELKQFGSCPPIPATSDVILLRLDPDGQERWHQFRPAGLGAPSARLAWSGCLPVPPRGAGRRFWRSRMRWLPVALRVTRADGSTRLLQYGLDGTLVLDTLLEFPCAALAARRNGAILSIGIAGAGTTDRYVGWQYFRQEFSEFLPRITAGSGRDQSVDIALDGEGNVVLAGWSGSGKTAGIQVAKVAPRYYWEPPELWLPNMHR